MRQFISILIAFFLVSFCYAQEKTVRVTMKSGTTITGTAIEINPASHIVVRVAGFDSKIDMSEIASIEDLALSSSNSFEKNDEVVSYLDQGDYPESYSLQVGPYTIEMVLVRGNRFDMGFDGKGSMSMKSEPIHTVQLSSFYVNKAAIEDDLVAFLKKGIEKHDERHRVYVSRAIKDVNSVVERIAAEVGMPICLLSEAQCEYILTSTNIDNLEVDKEEFILCRDFFSDYTKSSQPQIDPLGPSTGSAPVIRNMAAKGNEVHRRYSSTTSSSSSSTFSPMNGLRIRIAIPAAEVIGGK